MMVTKASSGDGDDLSDSGLEYGKRFLSLVATNVVGHCGPKLQVRAMLSQTDPAKPTALDKTANDVGRNAASLAKNPRLGMVYRQLEKFSETDRAALGAQATALRGRLAAL